jgi:glycosyltransferase involved in cell wall biosynthesis
MPSFNQRQYIERSILSVLNQNYPNLELIIIDGGSSDGTVDVIKKYGRFIAHWVSEPDNGQSCALNRGFARATGEIFGWLNSDDLYLPGALHYAEAALSSHAQKGIVHGDWLSIDGDDRVIAYEYSFDFNVNHFKYEGFHLNAQSMFWRREVHGRFGQFHEDLKNTMDYQMLVAFGINEGNQSFYRLPVALGCFRRYEGQKTAGFDSHVLSEHQRIAARYGFSDKYRWTGQLKRLGYRFRRAFWYVKRGGMRYCWARLWEGPPPAVQRIERAGSRLQSMKNTVDL